MLVLGGKDVDIDANGILFLLLNVVKSILDEPCFAYSAW
jgi:hypothetical protein